MITFADVRVAYKDGAYSNFDSMKRLVALLFPPPPLDAPLFCRRVTLQQ